MSAHRQEARRIKYHALPKSPAQRVVVHYTAAVVDAMDQAVARVLDTLDEEGIADNTIVMFFSDNGATRVYGRGGGDNTPFRGGKGEVYEGGIRVASVIRWPEKIPAGLNLDQTMTVMDVFFRRWQKRQAFAPQNQLEFDGIDMTPALLDNKEVLQG